MVDRPTPLLGLHDIVYLDLITKNIDAIGELPSQYDDLVSDIDGLENNNHNSKRPVHKKGPVMNGKPHRQTTPGTSVINTQKNEASKASVLRVF